MRASYRKGVEWIALNDEDGATEDMKFADAVEFVSEQVSVVLLAELFGKEPEVVARAIVRFRIREARA